MNDREAGADGVDDVGLAVDGGDCDVCRELDVAEVSPGAVRVLELAVVEAAAEVARGATKIVSPFCSSRSPCCELYIIYRPATRRVYSL